MFIVLVKHLEAKESCVLFSTILVCLLLALHDAYISRITDFLWAITTTVTTDGQTNHFTP